MSSINRRQKLDEQRTGELRTYISQCIMDSKKRYDAEYQNQIYEKLKDEIAKYVSKKADEIIQQILNSSSIKLNEILPSDKRNEMIQQCYDFFNELVLEYQPNVQKKQQLQHYLYKQTMEKISKGNFEELALQIQRINDY